MTDKQKIEELRDALRETVSMLNWHLNKSVPYSEVDQSDFFNGTANAINAGEAILEKT